MLKAWVKNVYSLCVDGVFHGGYSYTGERKTFYSPAICRVQPTFSTYFIPTFSPYSYTAIFSNLPLIKSDFYTLSTAPIISKMNKK